ncbi:alpha/beta hydrolase [Pseudovibrio sp. Tun.PSC04-5.I4]|uniref:alpha/beta fold hydrolase n=1 Tax=Pseudovibrio sp. Tun.PSC04-5.I4 TaxID=1798213 RepID=UPI000888E1D6|nr:alpha/beta hydrolase [Pseudovibrio sp. Tun.PSC04-5.I4]SDR13586.1 Pimeloyl-ACP methyl ester carboxylesterase [Pseudovibrio sp. Tun.PSC04-5.I4]
MLQTSDNLDHDLQNLTGTTRFTWKASDGLVLSANIWEVKKPAGPTVLCLPGLTRNTRDFYRLANFLQSKNLPVIAMDYRGRGLSEFSTDFETYNLDQEADDIDRGLAALRLEKFALIGTSRGGLHAMSMGKRYPERLLSVIINDIGPYIEPSALDDIIATVGTQLSQPNMAVAAEYLQGIHSKSFTAMTKSDWVTFAHQLFSPTSEGVSLSYDKKLGDAVRGKNKPAPDVNMWPLFEGIKSVPHLLLHGENSALLSVKTVGEMRAHHKDMNLLTIPNQGHAPLLWDDLTQQTILTFIQAHPD